MYSYIYTWKMKSFCWRRHFMTSGCVSMKCLRSHLRNGNTRYSLLCDRIRSFNCDAVSGDSQARLGGVRRREP
jgi:hypothetical protein